MKKWKGLDTYGNCKVGIETPFWSWRATSDLTLIPPRLWEVTFGWLLSGGSIFQMPRASKRSCVPSRHFCLVSAATRWSFTNCQRVGLVRVLSSVFTRIFMEGLAKDGRHIFKSLGQTGPNQLSVYPTLWIMPFKGTQEEQHSRECREWDW